MKALTPTKMPSLILNLRAGQSAFHNLDQGTIIFVQEGAIHMVAQLYLAGLMFPHRIQLRGGQSHSIEAAQHYQLQANATTSTIILTPQTRQRNRLWMYLITKAAPLRRTKFRLFI